MLIRPARTVLMNTQAFMMGDEALCYSHAKINSVEKAFMTIEDMDSTTAY